MQLRLHRIQVELIYQGYMVKVKVKVTGAKKHEISSCHPFCDRHGNHSNSESISVMQGMQLLVAQPPPTPPAPQCV